MKKINLLTIYCHIKSKTEKKKLYLNLTETQTIVLVRLAII